METIFVDITTFIMDCKENENAGKFMEIGLHPFKNNLQCQCYIEVPSVTKSN